MALSNGWFFPNFWNASKIRGASYYTVYTMSMSKIMWLQYYWVYHISFTCCSLLAVQLVPDIISKLSKIGSEKVKWLKKAVPKSWIPPFYFYTAIYGPATTSTK